MPRYNSMVLSFLLACCILVPGFGNDVDNGGQKGIVRTISAYTLGQTGMNVGGSVRGASDLDYITHATHGGSAISTTTHWLTTEQPALMSADLFFAYGLLNKWDISFCMPFYYDWTGWEGAHRSGVGDLEIATKLAYPFAKENAFFTHSYYFKVTVPTGMADRGYFPRHAYFISIDTANPNSRLYTAKSVLFNPMLLWTLDFGRLSPKFNAQLHVNFGGVVTPIKNASAAVAAVGFEYTPATPVTLFLEISGESRITWYTETFSVRDFDNDAFRVTPGMRINTKPGIYLQLAGDFGVSERRDEYRTTWDRGGYRYSTAILPKYGVHFSFGWTGIAKEPDSDGDGIIDKEDKCQLVAEDKDGFEDEDGCPDLDNDNDGISDLKDKCPDKPATCDGCPVLDTDGDGINDPLDKCPNDLEDKDGFEDTDGCPDPDNDNDGILDASDGCPAKAEDVDGFEDTDGCPDFDNDNDGIIDPNDNCPNKAGVAENNGCPKTEEIKRGPIILHGVNFKTGSANLIESSFIALNKVYETLVEWPEINLEIQGYTDSSGNNDKNKALSQKRAEAVSQYLVNKGISWSRLVPVGYGEDSPIADNATAGGRAQNRRVELRRID
jgi:outer membrane protein OmpA-like peptidoglycan-associated protein/predicted small secreted protein